MTWYIIYLTMVTYYIILSETVAVLRQMSVFLMVIAIWYPVMNVANISCSLSYDEGRLCQEIYPTWIWTQIRWMGASTAWRNYFYNTMLLIDSSSSIIVFVKSVSAWDIAQLQIIWDMTSLDVLLAVLYLIHLNRDVRVRVIVLTLSLKPYLSEDHCSRRA